MLRIILSYGDDCYHDDHAFSLVEKWVCTAGVEVLIFTFVFCVYKSNSVVSFPLNISKPSQPFLSINREEIKTICIEFDGKSTFSQLIFINRQYPIDKPQRIQLIN